VLRASRFPLPASRCDAVVQGSVALLVITCALAMGGRQYWARALIQLTAAVLGIVWSVRSTRRGDAETRRHGDTEIQERRCPILRVSASSLFQADLRVSASILLLLLLIPLIPLSPAVMRALSPSAFTIATQALPGWPERAPFDDLRQTLDLQPARLASAAQLAAAGAWRPLSLVPRDTAQTLSLGAAYVLVGALMAFYPWPGGGTKAVTTVLTALITLGAIEAIYGLLTASTGHNRLFWFECSGACMGTYGNRDHYAGLLEMLFPLTLARAAVCYTTLRCEAGAIRHAPALFRKRTYIDALAGTAGRFIAAAAIALLLIVAMAVSGSRSAFAATIASLLIMVRLLPGTQPPSRRSQKKGPPQGERNVFSQDNNATARPEEPPSSRGVSKGHSQSAIRNPHFLSLAIAALAILWLSYPQLFGKLWVEDQLRPLMAADTFNIALNFPLFGVGLGNFASAFPLYRARSVEVWQWGVSDAHNDYLQWIAEVGFPAAILSFILLAVFGRRVWRALKAAEERTPESMTRWGLAAGILAMLFHSFTDFNLHIPANALVFSVLIGAIIRLIPLDHGTTGQRDHKTILLPPSPVVLLSRSPVVLLSLFCLLWSAWIWRQWDANAAYAAVYPDLSYRDLVAAPAEAEESEAMRLVQRAAKLAPGDSRFQAAVGEHIVKRAFDATTALAETDALLDAALVAYMRSLWAAPLQPQVMLALAAAAEPIYEPDPGTEPGVIYDLVGRAAALAPYGGGR